MMGSTNAVFALGGLGRLELDAAPVLPEPGAPCAGASRRSCKKRQEIKLERLN
jgi:hypothetical protein